MERGRTLLETIAVLAVMGIIIAGGVTGLSWTMRKIKVESNIKDMNLVAVDIFSEPVNFARTNIDQGIVFRGMNSSEQTATKTAEDMFAVSMSGLDLSVCEDMFEQARHYEMIHESTFTQADICANGRAVFYYQLDSHVTDNQGCGYGMVWDETAGMCCRSLTLPESNECRIYTMVNASAGVCPDYTQTNLSGPCGTNGYCNNGACVSCPASTESCSIDADEYDPATQCLMTKMVVCGDEQVCSNGKCICKGLKVLNEQTGKCECSFVPLNGNEETCECDYPLDLIDGVCVQECPGAIGMTGFRDENGNCLCDTNAGYEEISIDNTWCNCDSDRYYWNNPDGSCMTCLQTTKEWARNQFGDSSSINRTDPNKEDYMIPLFEVDSESVDEEGWYCGFHKVGTAGQRYYYNPSTGDYCEAMEILKKDSAGNFYCSSDCGVNGETRQEGARGGTWGSCGCGQFLLWLNNKCTSLCEINYTNYDGDCIKCTVGQLSYDKITCQTAKPLCAEKWGVDQSEVAWLYTYWLLNTPSSCHASSGYSVQTDSGECAWYHGCYAMEGILSNCNFNEIITSDCTCPTGGEEGEYCCSSAQIKTSSGCVSCSNNSIPNQTHDECVACKHNEIPSLDRTSCQKCPDGQIPNRSNTKCYACPTGTEPDKTGTACISIS